MRVREEGLGWFLGFWKDCSMGDDDVSFGYAKFEVFDNNLRGFVL